MARWRQLGRAGLMPDWSVKIALDCRAAERTEAEYRLQCAKERFMDIVARNRAYHADRLMPRWPMIGASVHGLHSPDWQSGQPLPDMLAAFREPLDGNRPCREVELFRGGTPGLEDILGNTPHGPVSRPRPPFDWQQIEELAREWPYGPSLN
jgi:hypothetical protein